MHYIYMYICIYNINLTPSPSFEGLVLPFIDEEAGFQRCDLLQIETHLDRLRIKTQSFWLQNLQLNTKQ